MKNILIVSGHTNTTSDSVANRTILETLESAIPACPTVYLDRFYPDFNIDVEAELAKLSKDLEYYKGFRESVLKKLSNERFVNNAPAAVVEGERRKLADAETKIKNLEDSISALSK